MARGKTVRIYLADGSASGVRHAEITNWSGQALACPRTRFTDLKAWPETNRPGVYFLFGLDEESGRDVAYIGEAEVVIERISSHVSGKDFWTDLVAFTSKDDNLTKAHVRYLESRLVQLAQNAGRYILTNSVSPQPASLPRADQDAMEDYIESLGMLLAALGHKVLVPLTTKPASPSSQPNATATSRIDLTTPTEASPIPATSKEPTNYSLRVGRIYATAQKTNEGLVVLAGSEAAPDSQPSLSSGYRAIREKLIASGALLVADGKARFSRDHLFRSPSQAAAVIVGYSINGRDAWKAEDSRTWGQIEDAAAQSLLKELRVLGSEPAN
ncbi:MAG: GIY-YIG nuclease family protein [Nevskiaceae bacterium]|nr:MAG: GIY-YIG nuclease family protein [Nevskiaceae bacterium]